MNKAEKGRRKQKRESTKGRKEIGGKRKSSLEMKTYFAHMTGHSSVSADFRT
jgi:hypothetical protein